jgi:hypothetical protein
MKRSSRAAAHSSSAAPGVRHQGGGAAPPRGSWRAMRGASIACKRSWSRPRRARGAGEGAAEGFRGERADLPAVWSMTSGLGVGGLLNRIVLMLLGHSGRCAARDASLPSSARSRPAGRWGAGRRAVALSGDAGPTQPLPVPAPAPTAAFLAVLKAYSYIGCLPRARAGRAGRGGGGAARRSAAAVNSRQNGGESGGGLCLGCQDCCGSCPGARERRSRNKYGRRQRHKRAVVEALRKIGVGPRCPNGAGPA